MPFTPLGNLRNCDSSQKTDDHHDREGFQKCEATITSNEVAKARSHRRLANRFGQSIHPAMEAREDCTDLVRPQTYMRRELRHSFAADRLLGYFEDILPT